MTDPRCGTYAGAVAHAAAKEPPCAACLAAKREYIAAWRFRTGKVRHPMRCPSCGSVFRSHRCAGPDMPH